MNDLWVGLLNLGVILLTTIGVILLSRKMIRDGEEIIDLFYPEDEQEGECG